MKTLGDYLIESKKTYKFKVSVAGDLPEGFEANLKTAMEKYSVVSFAKGKKTPIQEKPLYFPNLENVEVTFFEVEVHYPTTDYILQEYIARNCTVPATHIVVKNLNNPSEKIKDFSEETVYEPLLTKEDMGGPSAQSSVGQSRVMELLKELETARKERNDVSDSGFKLEATKEESQNKKSIIGN
jgi:hypothetical protein